MRSSTYPQTLPANSRRRESAQPAKPQHNPWHPGKMATRVQKVKDTYLMGSTPAIDVVLITSPSIMPEPGNRSKRKYGSSKGVRTDMPTEEPPNKQQNRGQNPFNGPAPVMQMTSVRGVNALAQLRARKEAAFAKMKARGCVSWELIFADVVFVEMPKDTQQVITQLHRDARGEGAPESERKSENETPGALQANEDDDWVTIDEEMDPRNIASAIDHIVADPKYVVCMVTILILSFCKVVSAVSSRYSNLADAQTTTSSKLGA